MTRNGRKQSSRTQRPKQPAKRPDRRPPPSRALSAAKRSVATLPAIGEWWKLADIAASIHVHPKTLRRWIEREAFFKKVKGTFFVELGGFKVWWARQGYEPAAELP